MLTLENFLNSGGLAPLPTSASAECPICLEHATDPVVVEGIICAQGCHHQHRVFCQYCILHWLIDRGTCVICRTPLFAQEPGQQQQQQQQVEAEEAEEEAEEEHFQAPVSFHLPVYQYEHMFLAEPVDDRDHAPLIVAHIDAVVDWAEDAAAGPAPILATSSVRTDLRLLAHWLLMSANLFIDFRGPTAASYTIVEDLVQGVFCACAQAHMEEPIGSTCEELYQKLVRLTFGQHLVDTTGAFAALEEAVRQGLPLPVAETDAQRFAMQVIRDLANSSVRVFSYYAIVLGGEAT